MYQSWARWEIDYLSKSSADEFNEGTIYRGVERVIEPKRMANTQKLALQEVVNNQRMESDISAMRREAPMGALASNAVAGAKKSRGGEVRERN